MKVGLFVTLEHEAHEDSTEHARRDGVNAK